MTSVFRPQFRMHFLSLPCIFLFPSCYYHLFDHQTVLFAYDKRISSYYCVISLTLNFNPLNAELNPICHLLALLGAHHILHVSRIRVNKIYQAENFALHHHMKRTLCRALYPSRCSEVARMLLTIWSELATNTLS